MSYMSRMEQMFQNDSPLRANLKGGGGGGGGGATMTRQGAQRPGFIRRVVSAVRGGVRGARAGWNANG